MNGLGKLTRLQRQMVMAELSAGEHKAASVGIIEECAASSPACPHCADDRVVKNGSADGLQRYKCRSCHKTFNTLTGTPLARMRMKGKWLEQVAVLRDGLSLPQVTERMGISRHTAFRWRHRFLALPKTVKAQALAGIAETDETFFLRSNIAGVYRVQNGNAYDSRLKDWMRRFKGVATRYLDSYLGWFRAIDRTRGGSLNPASLLALAVRA